MIRQILETNGCKMTDDEFSETMKITTADIKFNRFGFKKKTSISNIINISELCYKVLKE